MSNHLKNIESKFQSFSKLTCIAGGWLLILLSVMICVEVFLRKVFSLSLQGVDEYGGYALAITASLGLAYAFYEGTHIKIDVLVRLFPQPIRIASSLLAQVTLFGVASFLAYRTVLHTLESWELSAFANTPLRTPLYVPQGIWALGFTLFMIVLGIRLLLVLELAVRRNGTELKELLDTNQDEEEVKIAIAQASRLSEKDSLRCP